MGREFFSRFCPSRFYKILAFWGNWWCPPLWPSPRGIMVNHWGPAVTRHTALLCFAGSSWFVCYLGLCKWLVSRFMHAHISLICSFSCSGEECSQCHSPVTTSPNSSGLSEYWGNWETMESFQCGLLFCWHLSTHYFLFPFKSLLFFSLAFACAHLLFFLQYLTPPFLDSHSFALFFLSRWEPRPWHHCCNIWSYHCPLRCK